jgi:serine/threonine protein phosphatase PrpC
MTTGSTDSTEPPAAEVPDDPEWWRHPNGRWVVGDAGRQPEVVSVPSIGLAVTRPDTVIDGGRLGALEYRATSQRGLGHRQAGTPRQDAYVVRPTRDGRWLAGCVADGVSEGKRSHEAADLVCRDLTAVLLDALAEITAEVEPSTWDEVVRRLPWQEAAERASAAVREAATEVVQGVYQRRGDTDALARLAQRPLTESQARQVMSTTAIAFAVSAQPAADGGHPAVVAVVAGDSSALLLSDGAWEPLTAVKNEDAEVASSAVHPLSREAEVRTVTRHLRPGQAVAVITDGLGDPLGAGRGVVGRFLASMWARPPDLLDFGQHAGFYRRTFTDDRTAVVVWVEPDAG